MKQVQSYKKIIYRWICPYCGAFNETAERHIEMVILTCAECFKDVEDINSPSMENKEA